MKHKQIAYGSNLYVQTNKDTNIILESMTDASFWSNITSGLTILFSFVEDESLLDGNRGPKTSRTVYHQKKFTSHSCTEGNGE